MIRSDDLIALFQLMYAEHWSYEWGAARRGCVDCSGAFVYAFRQLGGSIYHGSNTIARKYVGAFQKTPVPGFAAFKWKKTDTAKYPDGRGDFYHIGLVDSDGEHVLNAKGTKAGFCRDPVGSWHSFAPLLGVTYPTTGSAGGPPFPAEPGRADAEKGESWSVTEYPAAVKVSSGRLNMRSGPGTEHSIVERLPNGTPLVVIAEFDTDGDGNADWAFVDEDGVQGYVSMAFIERTAYPTAAAVPPSPQSWEGQETEGPPSPQLAGEMSPAGDRGALGVFIPCDSEEEARRYAGNIKGAVLIRYDKPPGSPDGEGE